MTRQDAKRLLANVEVMKAFVEGKKIQYNDGTETKPDWRDVASPSFDMSTAFYRVKPDPEVAYIVEGLRGGTWCMWACVIGDSEKAYKMRQSAAKETYLSKPYFEDVRLRTFIERL